MGEIVFAVLPRGFRILLLIIKARSPRLPHNFSFLRGGKFVQPPRLLIDLH